MSKNERPEAHAQAKKPKMDARVRRTRDALGDALVELMQQKPFDDITIQDVLERAGVGRSTFYVHFKDKDDLFMSDADEFFEAMSMALVKHGDRSERVFPVMEFFAHVREMKNFVQSMKSAGKFHENMQLAHGHFARGIQKRMEMIPRGKSIPMAQRPAIAHAHAGALISMLEFWMNHGAKEDPRDMDTLFHRMVWGTDYQPPEPKAGRKVHMVGEHGR
jgi:AcrR family transcriptional regulator